LGHEEDGQGARAAGFGVGLGDDGVIIGVLRIVDQPLPPFEMIIDAIGFVVERRGDGAGA